MSRLRYQGIDRAVPAAIKKDYKKRVLATNDKMSEAWGNPEEMTGVQTEILSKKKASSSLV